MSQHPLVRDEHYVRRYLLRDEVLVVALRRSVVAILEPILTAVATLFVVLYITATAAPGNEQIVTALWWLWFVTLARLALKFHEWHREYFIATDRRLLLIYGFITRKVGMLPLSKVTDMTYQRSILGRLLGYGTFVLESAGQDQALSTIHFVPRPDQAYRAIMREIFVKNGDTEELDFVTDDDELLEEQNGPRERLRGWSDRLRRVVGPSGGTPSLRETSQNDRYPTQADPADGGGEVDPSPNRRLGIIAAARAARGQRGDRDTHTQHGPIRQARTGAIGVPDSSGLDASRMGGRDRERRRPERDDESLYRAGYDGYDDGTSWYDSDYSSSRTEPDDPTRS